MRTRAVRRGREVIGTHVLWRVRVLELVAVEQEFQGAFGEALLGEIRVEDLVRATAKAGHEA